MFPAIPFTYSALATYGTLNLTVSSPARTYAEPFDRATIKAYLKFPDANTSEDENLDAFIMAARVAAEIAQGRDLVEKQYDLSLDYWPCYRIELRPHLASVDLVRYRDSTGTQHAMVQDTDYIVDASKQPAAIVPPYGAIWPSFTPWPSSAILVRFTAGLTPTDPFWSMAGSTVKIGMKRLIAAWFTNRVPLDAKLEDIDDYGITSCLGYGANHAVR